MVKRWLVVIVLVVAGCGGGDQNQTLPTLQATSSAEGSSTQATPTMDAAALAQPIQTALEGLAGLQEVRSVSVSTLDGVTAVNIGAGIAEADDTEDTMNRILAAVQGAASGFTQVRVTTYVNNLPQRNWLWENGSWTSELLGG